MIVAFVVVLVSLVSWWNWPRGDARFVGKWRYSQLDGTPCVMTLHTNGSGCCELSPTYRNRFLWRVENDRLVTGCDLDGRSRQFAEWTSKKFFSLTGTHFMCGRHEQSIVEVTHDRMALKDDLDADARNMSMDSEPTTFDRIPE